MRKKLTMFGALTALVFGALAIFQGSANAAPGPVQGFDSTGAFTVNAGTCWDDGTGLGQHPSSTGDVTLGGQVICGPNTSETHVGLGTGVAVRSFTYIQLPQGNRLTLPITFTPSAAGEFGTDATKAVCGTPVAGDCGAGSSITGAVTAHTDLLCSGPAYDVLASAKSGVPAGWPDDPSDGTGWTGFDFTRTADNGLTGVPGGSNAYVNQIKPFPASFPFVSLDTAILTKLFLGGGGAGFPIPNTPLQLYTGTSIYRAGLNVSVALLGGNPQNPPTNDYLCLDSPQNSETNTEYVTPPTTSGLYPRWVIFTSAADFVNGAVNRIVDLQCVGVGTVTSGPGATDVGATDVDDDCLTPAGGDTNDANPDQDGDGLPDGIEANAGSSMTVADADADGANDYEEMFSFTNPTVADTDGDGSLDKQDSGADETVGTLVVDDTIADDNCPAIANADQLNTDSAPSYHGGNAAWNNKNAGTTVAAPPGGPPATTLVSTWASATISVTGTTATVTTSSAHGLFANQQVEISGVTGMGGTAAQNNSFRNAVNGVRSAGAPTATTFTFAIPALSPPSPTPVLAGAVTGTIIIRPATGDVTNPDQDRLGDACDTDDDNDNITDVAEGNVTYKQPWTGAGATSCVGDGSGVAGLIALNTLNGDSDQDMVLDGIECQQGARPDVASTAAPYNCLPASNGCAQPKAATAGEDPDADALYGSGIVGGNLSSENFYHTGNINQNNKTQVTDIDGDGAAGVADKDSDADWNIAALPGVPSALVGLQDGTEVRFYGTEPSNGDTDTDGCDDGREAADINGDRTVNPGDQATVANRLATIASLDNGKAGDPTASDGQVNPYGINFDQNKDKSINPGDQALVSFYVGKGGACQTTRQQGLSIAGATKLPF